MGDDNHRRWFTGNYQTRQTSSAFSSGGPSRLNPIRSTTYSMATARLRRVFRYPDDSGGEEPGREDLDEEEQELVISRLKAQNDRQNIGYSAIFSAVPIFPAVMLVPLALSGSMRLPERLFSLLGLLSLLLTACIMKFSPLQRLATEGLVSRSRILAAVLRFSVPVNAITCGLLALAYMMGPRASPASGTQLLLIYFVPGVMFTSVMVVRHAMATVELRHLEDLRYEYKGA
ncbi:hypothetical protein P170DRAFT_421056 [Aspergillus steynii IBT 23096]|uniref:Uncharacterized protein n=1 Tax=Aspergillus steynii IBT 23096 TaxID=1392250 RepID=A0A2I2GN88_9EURO|nr:uncharacterized protein P170DRAFT_421056 [Aspergillus steynii IBT 23096]PLB54320.1 hypothetical protein P170DRAFT_421056 [Aspergillus steynii IBT 23096]